MARPTKKALTEVKTKNKGVIGRPKGDTAIINEYKARMLNSPKSAKVLEAIYDAALTDGHPGQTAAWKLIVDRIVPISAFEVAKNGGHSAPQISINISSVGSPTSPVIETLDNSDIEDVEYKISDTE